MPAGDRRGGTKQNKKVFAAGRVASSFSAVKEAKRRFLEGRGHRHETHSDQRAEVKISGKNSGYDQTLPRRDIAHSSGNRISLFSSRSRILDSHNPSRNLGNKKEDNRPNILKKASSFNARLDDYTHRLVDKSCDYRTEETHSHLGIDRHPITTTTNSVDSRSITRPSLSLGYFGSSPNGFNQKGIESTRRGLGGQQFVTDISITNDEPLFAP